MKAEESPLHRARVFVEESLFEMLFRSDRNPRRIFNLSERLHDSARQAAEYRLKNLSGPAPQWQRTATLCGEVGPGLDLRAELERAASAYSIVLGRTITAEQLAPLSGVRCD